MNWEWLTFPVLFAFVLGALLMAIVINTEPGAYYVLLIGCIFAAAFGVAHLLTRKMIRRRKQ